MDDGFAPINPSDLLISLQRSGHADGTAIIPMKPVNVTLQCSSLRAQCRQAPLSGHAFDEEETMPARRSKHPFAMAICAAAGLLIATSAALAQEKTFELKLSHWVPPTHPLQKAMEEWGASVEKASNGTIKGVSVAAARKGL
jgi:hypothetical protein